MTPTFYILSTGTELTTGRSRDANAPYLARALVEEGYQIAGIGILPDDPQILLSTLEEFLRSPRISAVIMTGGMGPTEDDHTVDLLARLTGREIYEDEKALKKLRQKAALIPDRIQVENARRQVRVLRGSTVLPNKYGLAPGLLLEHKDKQNNTLLIAAMSGFPQEMHPIFEESLLPELRLRFPAAKKHRRVFYVYGEGESTFQAAVFAEGDAPSDGGSERKGEETAPAKGAKDAEPLSLPVPHDRLPSDFSWGISAGNGTLRIFFESSDEKRLQQLYELARERYRGFFLERSSYEEIHELCTEKGITIGSAESCTGGLIGKRITDRPGSSSYFLGSLVTYSNEAKIALLGVSEETLRLRGAVSDETARQMAEGTLKALGCHYSLAVTGIAGPDGGTPEKPVGTVYVACAGRDRETFSTKLYLPLDRERVREFTAGLALFHLQRFIKGEKASPE